MPVSCFTECNSLRELFGVLGKCQRITSLNEFGNSLKLHTETDSVHDLGSVQFSQGIVEFFWRNISKLGSCISPSSAYSISSATFGLGVWGAFDVLLANLLNEQTLRWWQK